MGTSHHTHADDEHIEPHMSVTITENDCHCNWDNSIKDIVGFGVSLEAQAMIIVKPCPLTELGRGSRWAILRRCTLTLLKSGSLRCYGRS